MKHILLVENNQVLQSFYRHAMEKAGYQVITTHSFWVALQLLAQRAVHLLLVDVMAQDFDEADMVQIICALPAAPPMIAIIGRTTPAHGERLLAITCRSGIQKALHKPFSVATLLQIAAELLHEPPIEGCAS